MKKAKIRVELNVDSKNLHGVQIFADDVEIMASEVAIYCDHTGCRAEINVPVDEVGGFLELAEDKVGAVCHVCATKLDGRYVEVSGFKEDGGATVNS